MDLTRVYARCLHGISGHLSAGTIVVEGRLTQDQVKIDIPLHIHV